MNNRSERSAPGTIFEQNRKSPVRYVQVQVSIDKDCASCGRGAWEGNTVADDKTVYLEVSEVVLLHYLVVAGCGF